MIQTIQNKIKQSEINRKSIPVGVRGQVSLTSLARFSSFISNVSMATETRSGEKKMKF